MTIHNFGHRAKKIYFSDFLTDDPLDGIRHAINRAYARADMAGDLVVKHIALGLLVDVASRRHNARLVMGR